MAVVSDLVVKYKGRPNENGTIAGVSDGLMVLL